MLGSGGGYPEKGIYTRNISAHHKSGISQSTEAPLLRAHDVGEMEGCFCQQNGHYIQRLRGDNGISMVEKGDVRRGRGALKGSGELCRQELMHQCRPHMQESRAQLGAWRSLRGVPKRAEQRGAGNVASRGTWRSDS